MHKHSKSVFLIIALLISVFAATTICQPTFAADSIDDITETTFFGNLKDDGEGCGVYTILNLIVDILTYGIAIAGALGIVVFGIQYLTAKGNTEQTQKAKRRMFEIVIGLVAWALLYAGIQFLLPGGHLNSNQTCATISDQELADLKAEQEAGKNPSSQGSDTDDPNSDKKPSTDKNAAIRKKIADNAIKYAWPYKVWHNNTSKLRQAPPGYRSAFKSVLYNWEKAYQKKHSHNSARLRGESCSSFAATMVRLSSKKQNQKYPGGFPTPSQGVYKYLKKSKCWKRVSGKLEPGDIDIQTKNGEGRHTAVIVYRKGKPTSVEASNGWSYGRINKAGNHPSRGRKHNYFRYICST